MAGFSEMIPLKDVLKQCSFIVDETLYSYIKQLVKFLMK